MFVIVNKNDKAVRDYGEKIHYGENGYPVLTNENISFADFEVDVFEVDAVPEEVQRHRYCFDVEAGFYVNENWVDPSLRYKLKPEYKAGYDQAILDLIEQGVL